MTFGILLAAGNFPAQALAQTPPPPPPPPPPPAGSSGSAPSVITRPDWLRRPAGENVDKAYPHRALEEGISGGAVLRCEVTVDGVLRACVVASESPLGYEFGAAALALSKYFEMRPATRDGKALTGATVTFPINFRCEGCGSSNSISPMTVEIAKMIWLSAPTAEDIKAVYPPTALQAGLSGRVVLRCVMRRDGGLMSCQDKLQGRDSDGFRAAAMKLTEKFRGPTEFGPKDSTHGAAVAVNIVFSSPETGKISPGGKPWLFRKPTADEMLTAQTLLSKGFTDGTATLECVVGVNTRLDQCRVTKESPEGQGAAAAALALAKSFGVSAWTDEGLPVLGATIRLPIRFKVEPDAAAAASP